MLKFRITSMKNREMEEALGRLEKKLMENATKGVSGNHAKIGKGEYEVQISYMFQNRVSDKIIEHELKKVVEEIDSEGKVKKIK